MKYESYMKEIKEIKEFIKNEEHYKTAFFKMVEEDKTELEKTMNEFVIFKPFKKLEYVFDYKNKELEKSLQLYLNQKIKELSVLCDRRDIFLGFFKEPKQTYNHLSDYIVDSKTGKVNFNKEDLTELNIVFYSNYFPTQLYYLFDDFGYHNIDKYEAVMNSFNRKASLLIRQNNDLLSKYNKDELIVNRLSTINQLLIDSQPTNEKQVLECFLYLNTKDKKVWNNKNTIFPYLSSFKYSYNFWKDALKQYNFLKSGLYKVKDRHLSKIQRLQKYLDVINKDIEYFISNEIKQITKKKTL